MTDDKREPGKPGRRKWDDERVVWVDKHLVPILEQQIRLPLEKLINEYRSEQVRLMTEHARRISSLEDDRRSTTLQCVLSAAVTAFLVAGVSWWHWN